MIRVNAGTTIRIRDEIKGQETCSRVIAVSADLIVTADHGGFIERFGPDDWKLARTRHIAENAR